MRAAVYVRISVDRPGEVSTEVQESACRALCAGRGWRVADVYLDRGRSAYRDVERPAYQRMLADVEAGRLDAVVFWKLDRIARSVITFNDFLQTVHRHGVVVASVNDTIDTASPMGRAMVQISAVFAELESAQISLRVRGALAAKASQGTPHHGGRRAYGYAQKIGDRPSQPQRPDGTDYPPDAIVPEEAEVIREAVRRTLDGESLRQIATDFNRRGIPTALDRAWHASPLAQILRSARIAGYREHRGAAYAGTWEPIIDMSTHTAVRAALVPDAGISARVKAGTPGLLSGIARCGECGTGLLRSMGGGGRNPSYRMYRCPDPKGRTGPDAPCGRIGVKLDTADDEVEKRVLAVLEAGLLAGHAGLVERQEALAKAEAALADDTAALEDINRERFVTRTLAHAEWSSLSGTLRAAVAEREAEVARLRSAVERALPDTLDAASAWKTGDTEWRRTFLRSIVRDMRVVRALEPEPNPATGRRRQRPTGERIKIKWRK